MGEERIVLACSVRHKCGALGQSRSNGDDTIFVPGADGLRAELVVDGEVWSASGARLHSGQNPFVVRWWFNACHMVSYALVLHGTGEPIDVDRFIEVNSADGTEKQHDFAGWTFRSAWL